MGCAIHSLMADATHGDPVMVAYLKHLLEQWARENPSASESSFALRAGLSRSAINNLKNIGRGGGPKTVAGFARALGTTPLAIYAAKEAWARGEQPTLAPAEQTGERYPNRAAAARVARELGTPDRAVVSVERDALDFEGDPPVTWWLAQMQLRASLFDRPASPADDARDAALRDELLSRPSQADRLRAEIERRKRQR